jgi:Bardet-Biedl syndrome 2 protein
VPSSEEPVVVAGGNCSIVGLDYQGEEQFWTVTGDNARAIEFMDWDEDNEVELVVGSDDFNIRVFKDEELIFDIKEEAAISIIKRIRSNVFGYALENGTYGCYYSRKRLWKQRAQGKVNAIVGMDFDMKDSQMQLVIGFDDGLIEVRRHRTGDLIHSVKFSGDQNLTLKEEPIANLFYYDFRMNGQK